jgi:cell wall assembly regulator SMI1
MQNYWSKVEQWMTQSSPELVAALQTGATEASLSSLETLIGGHRLPESFKAFYRQHDGQFPDQPYLFYGEELLGVGRIKKEWAIWDGLLQKNTFDDKDMKENVDAAIQPVWWSPYWVPFTYDGAGNHLCLDLNPTDAGQVGQVIRMWHDHPERVVVAPSFEAFIKKYTQDLEQGILVYSPDWNGIVSKAELIAAGEYYGS